MRRLKIFGRVLLIIIAVAAVGFVGLTAYSELRLTRERALYYQLQILRMGVNLYQIVNHQKPETLAEMLTHRYKLVPWDKKESHYIEGILLKTGGRAVDPFGNPYVYDPVNSWVRSSTKGYEFW